MKLVKISKDNKMKLNGLIEWLIYLIAYGIAFAIISLIFGETVKINVEHKVLYTLISILVIYLLNKTVKPILFRITIPITGVTLGLFYFIINTIILKLADYILGSMLDFDNIFMVLIVSIALSFTNLLIESFVVKPLLRRVKSNE